MSQGCNKCFIIFYLDVPVVLYIEKGRTARTIGCLYNGVSQSILCSMLAATKFILLVLFAEFSEPPSLTVLSKTDQGVVNKANPTRTLTG